MNKQQSILQPPRSRTFRLPVFPTKLIILLFSVLLFSCGKKGSVDITGYGAIADDTTNNARFIQKAIDEVSAKGGGQVLIPKGRFITGPVELKSNINLHFADGAVLLGSVKRLDYGSENARALISAKNQRNISITGKGLIDGRGRSVVKDLYRLLEAGKLQDSTWRKKRPGEKNRPRILVFKSCKNIRIKGITLQNGAGWIQDYVHCDGVDIDSIRVESTEYWNNDGIDIVNSRNVKIANSYVDVADDAICLKSEGGPGFVENVSVANCTLRSSASGFKLGTGSHGGFRNIKVRNIKVSNTYRSAIALEAVDGGFLEDVDIDGVEAKNTGNAIFIRLGHRNKTEKYSTVKNIRIRNVTVDVPAGKPDAGYPVEGPLPKTVQNVSPSSVTGLPGHPVQDVLLENITIRYEGGADKSKAFTSLDTLEKITENETGYPEFSMFGELPAWGFYVRHAEGIVFNNIKLVLKNDDYRPAMVFDEVKKLMVKGAYISGLKTSPVFVLRKSDDAVLEDLQTPFGMDAAIKKM